MALSKLQPGAWPDGRDPLDEQDLAAALDALLWPESSVLRSETRSRIVAVELRIAGTVAWSAAQPPLCVPGDGLTWEDVRNAARALMVERRLDSVGDGYDENWPASIAGRR